MSSDPDPDEERPPDRNLRTVGVGFALLVALVVAAAVTIPIVEAGAASPSGLTAASAESTVRRFVDQAVVQGDGYAACAYLTSSEQAAVGALGRTGGGCRTVLGGDTSLLHITTASDIRGMDLHATVHGTTAVVTAAGHGAAPVAFTLTPATAADRSIYDAPSAPWRISDGAARVVTGAS